MSPSQKLAGHLSAQWTVLFGALANWPVERVFGKQLAHISFIDVVNWASLNQ